MKLKHYLYFFLFGSLLSLLASCGAFSGVKKITNSYSSIPFIYRLSDTVGTNMTKKMADLTTSIKDTMLNDNTQNRINLLVNRIMHTVGLQVDSIKDTLIGKGTRTALTMLADSLLGNGTKGRLGAIRTELLGAKTNTLIGNIRNNLLGDTTVAKLLAIRNGVLDSTLKKSIDTLIASAILTVGTGYEKNISPKLDADLAKVQKASKQTLSDLTEFLMILVALLLGIAIAIFFIIRAWKDRQALQAVTSTIFTLPDTATKQDLVQGIQINATKTGIEPRLHSFLEKRRMLSSHKPV